MRLGLLVEGLDGSGVGLALSYQQRCRSLSLPDSFALALAKTNSWTLLTGDAGLRKLAAAESVDCHSVLWLLDRMFEGRVADRNELHTGLQAICRNRKSTSGCRLILALDLFVGNHVVCYLICRYRKGLIYLTLPFYKKRFSHP